MAKPKQVNESQQGPACPICGRPVKNDSPTYPFCTDRCRLVDLGRWFGGGYTISRPIEQRDLEEGSD
jgi:uncharacterized protein